MEAQDNNQFEERPAGQEPGDVLAADAAAETGEAGQTGAAAEEAAPQVAAPEAAPEEDAAPEAAAPEEVAAPQAAVPEEAIPEAAPEDAAPEAAAQDAAAPEDTTPEAAPALAPPKNWYIIHTYSGFENKVAESLRTRSEAFGFAHRIGQVLIPTEEVVELRNGKKVTSKRLVYPGYVLVEMEMDDALWHEVKNTPRVTGFVGGGNAPVPLSPDEVNSILFRQASSAERPRPKMTFEKNDSVRIVDGPFANFSGKVDEVNTERGTLRVMVTIFGRATPVELEFLQVEKA
ncbi:MAG TPA: transcription termination/antitermination protein NusG [Bryobacteraceae bacterium]|nr:transcription termination/antitermination protein NusG [Bryobacteraceae bacterium]